MAALTVLTVGVDEAVQRSQSADLLAAVAAAERTGDDSVRRVSAVISYASPQLTAAATSPAVRRSLNELVASTARTALPVTRSRLRALERVRVAPWHRTLRSAQGASVRYLRLRLAALEQLASSYDVAASSGAQVAQARLAARRALGRLVPEASVEAALPARQPFRPPASRPRTK